MGIDGSHGTATNMLVAMAKHNQKNVSTYTTSQTWIVLIDDISRIY